ncbi:MAG: aldo/keto reductase [Anaerolineae bacterium]|nr:aldo/keto reductase [Anaerolineae bacterium]
MEYRTLGKTGLTVSVLSYGASSLGGVFREIDEAEGIRTVHVALDLGINYIDVAPYYGITRAETVLGKALKGIPRDRYYLATKVGRYGDDEFDFSAKRVIASVDESLKRLGVDYVDIIQCHDIEFGSLDQIVNETIPALCRVQEQGKARFIGITGYPLKIFRYVLDRTEVDTILSYCHYTLNDTSLEGLISYLEEKGVGIINASPLGMGLLTNRGTPGWHPASDEIKKTCAQAAAYCRSKGVDIAKLALQFSLSNPRIHTTLVGTANPENIRKNVRWIEEPIDEELLAEVREILKPIANRTWPVGRPENN